MKHSKEREYDLLQNFRVQINLKNKQTSKQTENTYTHTHTHTPPHTKQTETKQQEK